MSGRGNRPPLLCIHGIADTGRAWDPVVARWQADHDVLTPTLPGHYGGPRLPAGPVTIASLADALEQVLDDAGHGSAHIVGNSLGGWLAVELARRGRARSVVALSPAGGWTRNSAFERRLMARMHAQRAILSRLAPRLEHAVTRPRLRGLLLRDLVAAPGRMPALQAAAFIRGVAGCTGFAATLQAVERERLAPDPELGHIPAVIAWGSHDRLLPAERCAEGFRRILPHADFRRIAGAGHVPMHDAPESVASIVTELVGVADPRTPASAEEDTT